VVVVQFSNCALFVDHADSYIETTWPDGAKAVARPNFQLSDIERAHDLGYGGDVWQMCLDHEAVHTLVGELLGAGHSVILHNVAYGDKRKWPPGGLEEEGYVTGLQRYLNTGRADAMVLGLFEQVRNRHGLYDQQVVRMARGLLVEIRRP
jgi:hypothetical protein